MKHPIGGTLVVLLAFQIPVHADEHLVSETAMQKRLSAAATERAASIAVLETVLDTPEAVQACRAASVSVASLKGQLPFLSDEELRDLSRRAAELETDPVAGMGTVGKVVLVVLIVVVLFVILLIAAANSLRGL